ncbi:MAG: Clp protease N-terminal domain-containing protein, partial [Gallionella sp.]
MRFDKLTTKLQQALSDAQSLAVGADNAYIEPQHLLLALLNDSDSGTASLLSRAGANVGALKPALQQALERLAKVEDHSGEVQMGRDLSNLFNLADKAAQKRGDQFIASELFLLAACDDKGETGRLLKQHGVSRGPLE